MAMPVDAREGYAVYARLQLVKTISEAHRKPQIWKHQLVKHNKRAAAMCEELASKFRERETEDAFLAYREDRLQKAGNKMTTWAKLTVLPGEQLQWLADHAYMRTHIKGGAYMITQESLLRLADVGYHTFKIWTSKVLKTVDQESFHPWLPLSEEEEFAEKQRISKTPDSNVRNAQNKWVNDVLGQRRRHKADYFDRVDQDFKMNFKEATTSIKALGAIHALLLMAEGRVGEENCWLMSEQGALGSFGFINPAWHPKLMETAKSTSTNQYHVEIMMHHAMHSMSEAVANKNAKMVAKDAAWEAVTITRALVQRFDPSGQLAAYMRKSLALGRGIVPEEMT